MTWAETTEVPWAVDALVAIGFSPGDARRLAPRLPLVEARLLVEVERGTATSAWLPEANPAAVLIWLSHGLGARQACDLARMGRGVLDLIVILDAVKTSHPSAIWSHGTIDLVCEWAAERTTHRSRLTDYIAPEVTSEGAARFEADPLSRRHGGAAPTTRGLPQSSWVYTANDHMLRPGERPSDAPERRADAHGPGRNGRCPALISKAECVLPGSQLRLPAPLGGVQRPESNERDP